VTTENIRTRNFLVGLLSNQGEWQETYISVNQSTGADMSQERDTIKEYDEILSELRELMVAKNADYGDSWRAMRLPSITDQILVKVCRIRSLEESKVPPKVSEGIEAEYRDIINYCIFALIKMREAKTT
jgi:hypothetical protein